MAVFRLWQQNNILKRNKYQFIKIHFVGDELIHADMTKLIGTLHEYVNMAKNTFIIIMNHFPSCTHNLIQYFDTEGHCLPTCYALIIGAD
jgi:hypothetical protein